MKASSDKLFINRPTSLKCCSFSIWKSGT